VSRSRSRAGVAGLLAAALPAALLVLTPTPAAVAAPTPQGAGLDKHDRELLADARAEGDKNVTLLIASKPGANKTVLSGITALGGTVQKRDDDVSYLRVSVPIGKAEAAARVTGVQAADLDEVVPLDDPAPQGQQAPTPQTPPGANTPAENPYLPTQDTGAPQFVAAHPSWDGRGVTVGIVDSGVDLDHPARQTTSTGAR
jgi:hypothetical protein